MIFPVHIEVRTGTKKGKYSQREEDEFYEKHDGAGPQLVFSHIDALCDWMNRLRRFPVTLSATPQLIQTRDVRQWNG
jgi:hypothetical protein